MRAHIFYNHLTMPTYEYECTRCSHTFEAFQRMSDKPLSRCPKCRCKVKRLLGTGAGLLFKGSGFYETDYRSESYRKGASADKKTTEKPAKKEGAKSDKKTAAAKNTANKKTPKTTR